MDHEGGLEHGEVVRDRRAADLARPREGRGLEHAAALRHEQLDEALEGLPPLEAEQLEDVLGPVGVDPLLEVTLRRRLGQEEGRQASVQQPVREVLVAEVDEVGERHRRQPDLRLAAGEGVAEPRRGSEGRGAGRQDAGGREVVGGDLEELRGVRQPMHLVQDDPLAAMLAKETFRIFQQPAHPRQLAVEILAVGERLAEDTLADAAHPHEPDDGAMAPYALEADSPRHSRNHATNIALGSTRRNSAGAIRRGHRPRDPWRNETIFDDFGVARLW